MEEETAEAEKKIDEKKKEFENKENGFYQKLESMRLQLETSKDEVAATQKEIVRIQKQHRKELSEARSEADNIRDELAKEIQSGRRSVDNTATLLEMENALDEVTRDRDTLARELQAIISKENKHEEWANKCRQLEDDKKEISSQLEETSKKQGELEHEIMLQKSLNSDLQTRLELSMKKAETAEAESDALRDEVSNLSSQIITQYETSKDGQGKLDKLVTQLHQELQVEKEANTKRQESLSQQLERERKLVKELQRQIAVRNEEAANEKLENGLNSAAREDELKKFNELEARNKHLEEELTKVWNQLKDVLDKLTASEQRKHELELEIERISRRHIDGELSDSVYQQKIELLERKIVNLKRDLDDATMRQQAAELHLRESATLKMDLQQERDEVIKIRNQLQQEKLERAMQEQTAIDMKLQLNSVKDKESKLHEDNMNLHHKLLDTESKLYITEDRSRSASDMVQLAEMGKKALMEQVIKLQKEVEVLQIDQLKYGEKLDFQLRKYEEKKVYCKNKLQHARDVFGRQKKMLADHLKNMEDDLSLTKTQLRKELEWKNEMENTLQKVLKEKRELLTKLIEIEETHRDTTNTLTTVDYRARYLDQENATLQTKLESMIRQKNIMEKLLKEYKLERQKEDITRAITNNGLLMSSRPETPGSISGFRPPTASSGIGTSLAHSFNSGDILNNPDVGLKSPPMVDSSYLNGLPVTRPFTSSGMRNYNSSLGGSMDTLDQLY
uniref:Myosin-11-like n=1 Tax=Saccoglossus kowalevskii TaxID=10224 RepID=A0ABM0LVY5_SACKO|nr:PREDICTED: myosin-11-like [Saccoglossus kowalevskii]